ncbi:MAG TPA: hypothetical protein G4N96_05860 [Chloroflexi bacterium]|nr:MAG: hypothetical protein B6243_11160 [Anaerolineaceae bacterium 4572_5.2]HEY84618.1 hypothetical protein [Chloroflexota bacterium]
MKRSLFTIPGLAALWAALPVIALAQDSNPEPTAVVAGVNVMLVLAPLAAAALGIERLLETLWGIFETILRMLQIDIATPTYVQLKTWISAGLGLIIGLIIAFAADLRMFGMLSLSAQPELDMFMTGLVIGAGSKFTHDVIGIFYESKKTLEEWKKLLEVRREREGAGERVSG